ncbi:DNA repair protein rad18 [Nemania diffusa]|nr:DNA repair protein rad18 [Nemania diffusa]
MNNDSFESVADSTDWLSTPISGLSAVEAALRCQICKDFYKTPMLTSCNHTFCSLCIRRALSADGKCPLCRASEQEMKLRSNWSMEEVVAAFTQTRPAVLDFAKRPLLPPIPTRPETPKRKAGDIDDVYNGNNQQLSNQQPPGKRLRSSARLSKTRGMEATAEIARQEADIPEPKPEPEPEPKPNDGLVQCPICLKRMKLLLVDRHIETTCTGQPQKDPEPPAQPLYRSPSKSTTIAGAFAPSSSTTFSSVLSQKVQPPPDRLPTLNYSMLRETQLRKELADLSLSTTGNRGMLERRHREWVMIWNANCDSQRPRQRAALVHDLDVWERTLGSRAPTGSRSAATGAQIRDKDFDGAAWAAKHDTSFRDLIANARRTRAQAQTKSSPDEGGTGNKVNSTPPSDKAVGTTKVVEPRTPELIDRGRVVVDLVDSPPGATKVERIKEQKESESKYI